MQEQKTKSTRKKNAVMRFATMMVPVILLLVLLSQTAFAQNTYVITDGERVLIHTSSATDPATVLDEAGLSLGEDDTYTTSPGLGVSEITVQRSTDSAGDDLRMTKATISQSEQTYTVGIPHETSYINDASLPTGVKKVLTEGQDGQMQCLASVSYRNGYEIDRTLLKKTVTHQPVNELIAVGTGPVQDEQSGKPVIGDGYITLPTGETLTYSSTMVVQATAYSHLDEGCDMITSTGTTVHIGTVAVDPRLIPYGTRMYIVSNDGEFVYGVSTAEDCGGAIIDKRIDLYYPTKAQCFDFGRRDCTIYFLTPGQ